MSYRINRGWTRLPVCVQYTGVRGSSEGSFYIGGKGEGGRLGHEMLSASSVAAQTSPLPIVFSLAFLTFVLHISSKTLLIPLMMKALVDLRIMTIAGRRMAKTPDALE